MDRVRLGRVLGRGTRLAARTAYEAFDAATSPGPARGQAGSATPRPGTIFPPIGSPRGNPVQQTRRRVTQAGAVISSSRGVLAPVRRASRAVSLEVTGSFFALFALSFGMGMWRARADLHAGAHGLLRFSTYGVLAFFFLYCSISSFSRARRLT